MAHALARLSWRSLKCCGTSALGRRPEPATACEEYGLTPIGVLTSPACSVEGGYRCMRRHA